MYEDMSMSELLDAIEKDDSITCEDLDNMIGNVLFGHNRQLPENFEIVPTNHGLIKPSIWSTNRKKCPSPNEVRKLLDELSYSTSPYSEE